MPIPALSPWVSETESCALSPQELTEAPRTRAALAMQAGSGEGGKQWT